MARPVCGPVQGKGYAKNRERLESTLASDPSLAGREGFEPPIPLLVYPSFNRAHSAALPSSDVSHHNTSEAENDSKLHIAAVLSPHLKHRRRQLPQRAILRRLHQHFKHILVLHRRALQVLDRLGRFGDARAILAALGTEGFEEETMRFMKVLEGEVGWLVSLR